jgi:SAM-dependent methyltransferase
VAQQVNQHSDYQVVSLDISARMLGYAKLAGLSLLAQASFHDLPFHDSSFDRVYASFALNSSDPKLALTEVLRVLDTHGQIYVQEWGGIDPLSEIVSDVMSEFAVDDPLPELEKLRADCSQPIPWDQLETIEELSDIVRDVGFDAIQLETVKISIPFSRIQEFIKFKFAWPLRKAEFDAMSEDVRSLLLADLRENLGQHTNADGSLIWSPELVWLRAEKS